MKNDRYEKKIAELESDLQLALDQINVLRAEKETLKTKLLSEAENLNRSLIVFLSDVYQKLAKVQTGILENLNRLNIETSKTQKVKMNESIKVLRDALISTNLIADNSGAIELEGEDNEE
jgi:histidinol dehydrogenase